MKTAAFSSSKSASDIGRREVVTQRVAIGICDVGCWFHGMTIEPWKIDRNCLVFRGVLG